MTQARLLQKQRGQRRRLQNLAKMDALKPLSFVKPGTYYLVPQRRYLAKMDALAQKVLLIPAA